MKKQETEITTGVKGFDKDLKCRGFQYEIGKEYETKKEPIRCTENGFHFCENPIDIFGYYAPSDSKFHIVEGSGQKDTSEEDSKIAVSKIKIGAEISLFNMIKLGVDCILKRVNFKDAPATNTGDSSAATNTGNGSAATNTGYRSAATNTGDSSAATNTGDSSAATNTGDRSAATNTGYRSAATNTGYRSAATNTGDRSAATNTGYRSAATNKGDSSAATNEG
jgi:hypothetical protein